VADVVKAMSVPSREFESRALSEIRALPAAHPLRAILKLRGGERAHPPRRGWLLSFMLLYDPVRRLVEPPLANDLSILQIST